MNRRLSERMPTLQNLTFWHFQVAGWLAFWCGDLLFVLLQQIPPSEISAQLLDAPLGFTLTLGLRRFYVRWEYKCYSMLRLLFYMLLCSVGFALVWHVCMTATRYLLVGPHTLSLLWSRDFTYRWLSQIMPVGFGWSALYFGVRYWRDLDMERERAREARSLARLARLQMLRYQINPHFLFNALNSLRALINEDKRNANAMIEELSEFLRYSLASPDCGEVPLEQELEAVRHYLSIEKKRFEDKLQVDFDVEEPARRAPVLNFLLHPFIENAVKYGMRTSPMPLHIRVGASLRNGHLYLRVANTGSWLNGDEPGTRSSEGTGTGLENVRARLENAYPDRFRLETTERDGWVEAGLDIFQPVGKD